MSSVLNNTNLTSSVNAHNMPPHMRNVLNGSHGKIPRGLADADGNLTPGGVEMAILLRSQQAALADEQWTIKDSDKAIDDSIARGTLAVGTGASRYAPKSAPTTNAEYADKVMETSIAKGTLAVGTGASRYAPKPAPVVNKVSTTKTASSGKDSDKLMEQNVRAGTLAVGTSASKYAPKPASPASSAGKVSTSTSTSTSTSNTSPNSLKTAKTGGRDTGDSWSSEDLEGAMNTSARKDALTLGSDSPHKVNQAGPKSNPTAPKFNRAAYASSGAKSSSKSPPKAKAVAPKINPATPKLTPGYANSGSKNSHISENRDMDASIRQGPLTVGTAASRYAPRQASSNFKTANLDTKSSHSVEKAAPKFDRAAYGKSVAKSPSNIDTAPPKVLVPQVAPKMIPTAPKFNPAGNASSGTKPSYRFDRTAYGSPSTKSAANKNLSPAQRIAPGKVSVKKEREPETIRSPTRSPIASQAPSTGSCTPQKAQDNAVSTSKPSASEVGMSQKNDMSSASTAKPKSSQQNLDTEGKVTKSAAQTGCLGEPVAKAMHLPSTSESREPRESLTNKPLAQASQDVKANAAMDKQTQCSQQKEKILDKLRSTVSTLLDLAELDSHIKININININVSTGGNVAQEAQESPQLVLNTNGTQTSPNMNTHASGQSNSGKDAYQ